MNIRLKILKFGYLLLGGFFCCNVMAYKGAFALPQPSAHDIGLIDPEALVRLEKELQNTKKILQEMLDNQNTTMAKAKAESLGSAVKELFYVLGSFVLAGSGIVGFVHMIGLENVNNNIGVGLALIGLPAFIISLIGSYAFLKTAFGWLASLNKEEKYTTKEALDRTEKKITMLDCELKKIERILRTYNAQVIN